MIKIAAEINLEENLSTNIQKVQVDSFLTVSQKVRLVESLDV